MDIAEPEAVSLLQMMDLDRDGAVSVDDFMVRFMKNCSSVCPPSLFVYGEIFDIIAWMIEWQMHAQDSPWFSEARRATGRIKGSMLACGHQMYVKKNTAKILSIEQCCTKRDPSEPEMKSQ